MIRKEEYASRISSANRVGLVVINFDLIIDYLKEAKENISDEKSFMRNIKKSREFLREMRLSLNMDYEISKDYIAAYRFIDRLIASYLFSKSEEKYALALELLNKFRKTWSEVSEEDAALVMQNAEQIYAGLTYGKNGRLNEYIDTRADRGFKV